MSRHCQRKQREGGWFYWPAQRRKFRLRTCALAATRAVRAAAEARRGREGARRASTRLPPERHGKRDTLHRAPVGQELLFPRPARALAFWCSWGRLPKRHDVGGFVYNTSSSSTSTPRHNGQTRRTAPPSLARLVAARILSIIAALAKKKKRRARARARARAISIKGRARRAAGLLGFSPRRGQPQHQHAHDGEGDGSRCCLWLWWWWSSSWWWWWW